MNSLLTSCVQEPEAPRLEPNVGDQLARVKSWFEENKTNLRLPERGSNFRTESQELILPFFEKEPDWDQFHHYYFPDGREVFEVSLENATKYFPTSMLDSFPDRDPAELVIQNLLFVKHPTQERFDPLIARYYPDCEGSLLDFNRISYNNISPIWSGRLELFTYDERFYVGFRILEGELDHSYQYQVHEGDKKLDYSKFDVRCTVYYYPVGYQTCSGGSCHTTIERMVGVTSCSGSSGINSGGNYGFPSGGGSSSTGGATDGNGTCSSCYDPPSVPDPNLTVRIDLSIKSNPRLNCITNKMSLNRFINEIAKFTGTDNDPANTTLKLGPLSGPNGQMKNLGNGNYEITINSNADNLNRPDLLIAKTILHELVHAEIEEALRKKGVTTWDDDFGRNFDTYVKLYMGDNDQHHAYMAEQLLNKMGTALMNIHKNQFPEDYDKFLAYKRRNGEFPNGIPLDFYKNLCWEGLHTTKAFSVMSKITTNPPILRPLDKYRIDQKDGKELLTKPCGG
ncbi:hypothetical protein [Algoriphagus sp. oki45]|uniref:hypothetical protein n=1 Tax=Algoriphagus sp. oki45 TaxID=3067294 RepID=UPI0030C6CF18